jgi:hypothetical protein
MKTTTKQERRAAKRDAIARGRLRRKDYHYLYFWEPDPRAGVAAWARHRRQDPIPLRVAVKLKVTLGSNTNQ